MRSATVKYWPRPPVPEFSSRSSSTGATASAASDRTDRRGAHGDAHAPTGPALGDPLTQRALASRHHQPRRAGQDERPGKRAPARAAGREHRHHRGDGDEHTGQQLASPVLQAETRDGRDCEQELHRLYRARPAKAQARIQRPQRRHRQPAHEPPPLDPGHQHLAHVEQADDEREHRCQGPDPCSCRLGREHSDQQQVERDQQHGPGHVLEAQPRHPRGGRRQRQGDRWQHERGPDRGRGPPAWFAKREQQPDHEPDRHQQEAEPSAARRGGCRPSRRRSAAAYTSSSTKTIQPIVARGAVLFGRRARAHDVLLSAARRCATLRAWGTRARGTVARHACTSTGRRHHAGQCGCHRQRGQ